MAVEGCTQGWVVFQGLGDGAAFPPQTPQGQEEGTGASVLEEG